MKMNKTDLINQLKTGIYNVTFTKINGEVRVMPCTLQESFLPLTESKGTKKQNDDVVSVWCTDKQAWRSFRIDAVTDIEPAETV